MTHYRVASIEMILARIDIRSDRPFIVVLDGPGGSGKSTLAHELAEGFDGTTAIIHGDDFYADLDADYRASLEAEGGYREYFDWKRLRDQVLLPAHAGEAITYQRYDWVNEKMGDWVSAPVTNLLIVEGVYSSRPELRDLADLVVWVTTSEQERLRRQFARGENAEIWINRWKAAEYHFRDHVRVAQSGDIEIIGE